MVLETYIWKISGFKSQPYQDTIADIFVQDP